MTPKQIAIRLLQLGEKTSDPVPQLTLRVETRRTDNGASVIDDEVYFKRHQLPPLRDLAEWRILNVSSFSFGSNAIHARVHLKLQDLEKAAGMSWETAQSRLPKKKSAVIVIQ